MYISSERDRCPQEVSIFAKCGLRGVALRGVALRGVALRGVALRGVALRGKQVSIRYFAIFSIICQ